jgi:hypothetical protein
MEKIKIAASGIDQLRDRIQPALDNLNGHSVYQKLCSMDHVRTFMQYHAFAVWDFMSLVKALQRHYVPTAVPWFPPKNTQVARFINDIVLGEESDIDLHGNYNSHYMMYLDAMKEIGANTEPISSFVKELQMGSPLYETIANDNLPVGLRSFLKFTFETIESGEIHKIAAAFTFGREDIIPEMFLQVLSSSDELNSAPKFKYYLERHIELDGDEHGPMALKLMELACGNDSAKWEEAALTAQQAIKTRIQLWSTIQEILTKLPESI